MSAKAIVQMLERIDRALLAEIELLQEGRFQELREVQVETARAMQALDTLQTQGALQAKPPLPMLEKARIELAVITVGQRAEQARGLLGAALNGARNARTRIEGLVRAEAQIGTYDRSGAPVAMKPGGSPYNRTM